MSKVGTTRIRWILVSLFFSNSIWAATPCTELKEKINTNIYSKGIHDYNLQILPAAAASTELVSASGRVKVVGSCAGGTKKIVYWRSVGNVAAEESPSTVAEVQPSAQESQYRTLKQLRSRAE